MTRYELKAGHVYAAEQDGVILVGFADRQHGTQRYVLLSRSLEPDPHDIELGHDDLYVEFDGQERGGYGGVESLVLERHAATLHLKQREASLLGLDPVVRISFVADARTHEALGQQLLRLWAHRPEGLRV